LCEISHHVARVADDKNDGFRIELARLFEAVKNGLKYLLVATDEVNAVFAIFLFRTCGDDKEVGLGSFRRTAEADDDV